MKMGIKLRKNLRGYGLEIGFSVLITLMLGEMHSPFTSKMKMEKHRLFDIQ
jgi:hypothetical protein